MWQKSMSEALKEARDYRDSSDIDEKLTSPFQIKITPEPTSHSKDARKAYTGMYPKGPKPKKGGTYPTDIHAGTEEKQTQEGGPGSGPQANGVSKAKKQQSKAFDAATSKVKAKYGIIGGGIKGTKVLDDLSKAQQKQFYIDYDKAVAKL